MPAHELSLSVLLLAGGQGLRVGGQDKGLLTWRGEPLIAHLHRQVRELTDDLIISCNRNPDHYQPWADRLVTDSEPDYPGPMAGLRAGLALARHPLVLVLPCDTPGIDQTVLAPWLALARQAPGVPTLIRQGGQWEPLMAVLPRTLGAVFERAWAAGERSPRRVMLAGEVQAYDCPAHDPRLANLNTLALLDTYQGT